MGDNNTAVNWMRAEETRGAYEPQNFVRDQAIIEKLSYPKVLLQCEPVSIYEEILRTHTPRLQKRGIKYIIY